MVEKFTAIKAMLNGEMTEGFTKTDAEAFLAERITQAMKKSASNGDRKPTAKELAKIEADNGFKSTIVDVLANAENPMTIGEMQKSCEALSALSNQKLTSLLTSLLKANAIVRTEVKGKAHFALPSAEAEAE